TTLFRSMYTPEEAIEEMEFASRQLGYKVMMVGGLMRRRVPALEDEHPDASKFVEWYDVVGIESDHDYDSVWQKCRELRVAPSFHNGARSILLRNSPSNFCYNHIGHFASAGHAVCKALFFGGVTKRFPDLNFAFLEGGGAQPSRESPGAEARRELQRRRRSLRRAGHDRCRAGGVRAGRARPAQRRRFPGFHVRQRRAVLGRGEPGLLQGHRRREAGR